MEEAVRSRLAEALGEDAVDPGGRVTPADADALALVCRVCSETATPIAVTRRRAAEAAVDGTALVVSLAAFDAIEVEPRRGIARAGAAVEISALRAALVAAGLGLANGAPLPSGIGRLGDAVDAGALPRRSLTGIEAVTARGERVATAGAVWKDVAAYDLTAALLGAEGRLAIVTAVSLRLQPAGGAPGGSAPPAGTVRPSPVSAALAEAFDPDRLLRRAG